MLNIMDAEMKKKGIKKGDIAKFFDVSPGTVSNMFNRKYKIGYMKFIQLTRMIFGQYNHDFIRRFCRSAKTKIEVEALEWAYSNGDMEVLELLVEREKGYNNRNTTKEKQQIEESEPVTITSAYELQLQRMTGKIARELFYKKNHKMKRKVKNTDIAMFVLVHLNCMYSYIDRHSYREVWPLGVSLLEDIEEIENDYLRLSLEIRVKIALLYTGVRAKKYTECEIMANEILSRKGLIDDFPLHYNNVLICLSEIFALTDFEKSSSYINQAVEMMDKGYFDNNEGWKWKIKSTYDFIHIYHNKLNKDKLYLEAPDEKAHFLAKGNEEERKEAIRILNELQKEYGEDDEFVAYYKALALNDVELMREARAMFRDAGDYHYSQMATDFIENSK